MEQREVVAHDVWVDGTHEPFVRGVGFVAPAGVVTPVAVDPGTPQVALALAVGGRLPLASGSVTVGGSGTPEHLRLRTRIVDAADVTAPDESLPVRAVVAEELALAERPSGRRDVATVLASAGLQDRARDRWDHLPAATRTSLLLELGALHPGVRVLVVTGPDRHGGDVDGWLATATRLAGSGLTVVVLCAPATAALLADRLAAAPEAPTDTDTDTDTTGAVA